jgi:hypothetical protein
MVALSFSNYTSKIFSANLNAHYVRVSVFGHLPVCKRENTRKLSTVTSKLLFLGNWTYYVLNHNRDFSCLELEEGVEYRRLFSDKINCNVFS